MQNVYTYITVFNKCFAFAVQLRLSQRIWYSLEKSCNAVLLEAVSRTILGCIQRWKFLINKGENFLYFISKARQRLRKRASRAQGSWLVC